MPVRRQLGSATDSLALAARLLAHAAQPGEDALARGIAAEAVALLRLPAAAVLTPAADGARARVAPASRTAHGVDAAELADAAALLASREPYRRLLGPAAVALGALAGAAEPQRAALLLGLPGGEPRHVLAVAGAEDDVLDAALLDLAAAFAVAAGAALAHQARGAEHQRAADRHAALARAAKTLNASLDLGTLLTRICCEAALLIDADSAAVYRVADTDTLTLEAAHGLPPEFLGCTLDAGEGLAGKVLVADRPMMTEDYHRVGRPAPGSPWTSVRGSMAVPVHWGGALRGVLSVAYRRPPRLTQQHLDALESFAELAAVAFANASAHAGLAEAARTDPLTGCLNHAALHEGLAREIERAERTPGAGLSLVLLDLDRFKELNDEHGHLVGDEALRRVGHALRSATRPYDLAARYGGDEFALIAVEAGEDEAREIAARTVEQITLALGDLAEHGGPRATAGVAAWEPGLAPGDLIARADRSLLYGKRADRRGEVLAADDLPATFLPGRVERRDRRVPLAPPSAVLGWQPRPDDDAAARLRKRTRQLALANQLGARLAAMTDVAAICDAVAEELHEAFGYYMCAVVSIRPDGRVGSAAGRGAAFVRLGDADWSQDRDAGLIGRCLGTGAPVRSGDVTLEPETCLTWATQDVRSELVVPLRVGGVSWGVINLEEKDVDAFDGDDERLLEAVAELAGAALGSALRYQALERAYREATGAGT